MAEFDNAAVAAGVTYRTRDDADQTFGEAFIHRSAPPLRPGWSGHVVLGHRLRPYSFWHAAQLDFVESPFAGYEGRLEIGPLFIAVRVCQLAHPHSFAGAAWLREMWVSYRYGATLRETKLAGKSVLVSPFLRELNKFSAYLRDYHSRPVYGSAPDSKPLRVPWYLHEVATLRRFNPELTWSQAWNSSVGESAWKNAGMYQAHGQDLGIESPHDRAAAREAGYEL